MKKQSILMVLTVVLVLVMSACAPGVSSEALMEKSAEDMMSDSSDSDSMDEPAGSDMAMDNTSIPETRMEDADMAMEVTNTPEAMMADSDTDRLMSAPDWFDVELVNVNTGEAFTINGFSGKVVLVETMAQWCTNCLKQQQQVLALHELLAGNSDLVSIALDIDSNEDEAVLKAYAEKHGFDWVYAVSPAEVAREIGNLYGAQFLNPPSTPILIVDRHGEVHPLPFGIKSAEDLKQAIEPFLSEGM